MGSSAISPWGLLGQACYGKHEQARIPMQQKKGLSERRKQLVRTMSDLGDIILRLDELAKEHADNSAAAKGFRQIVVSIEGTRTALQSQYNELLVNAGS
ncbi:MAG TPA: hypothetical protein VG125_17310 [Pirellulales bacterium]|nr:hypothetical protein [Pirellulales bacterium]